MSAPDQSVRQQALDYQASFIVQAPAGSGKTELLTQRYLVLLSHVERQPEEIVAITFTRKAAAEMRARILQALQRGLSPDCPQEDHAKLTWQLARAVIERDKQSGWDILNNSHRLRITTIDALCASITQQLPILSRFGDQPTVTEEASQLYAKAIRQLLADLEQELPWQAALAKTLLHLDNRIDLLEKLLSGMLARREQWLDVLPLAKQGQGWRQALEQTMRLIVEQAIAAVADSMPKALQSELCQLLYFALSHLHEGSLSVQSSAELSDRLLNPELEDLPLLMQIAELMQTQEGQWRKSIDKRQGFPAKADIPSLNAQYKANKARMLEILDALSIDQAFRAAIANLKSLPPLQYSHQQWDILEALLLILPVLVAHLRVVFADNKLVDFNEIAISALQALGEEDSPTELALALDYQIRHLLVDEFQDTSQLQYRLLQALTRGWQTGDGRTLFLVGDPMQSIYRFRQADVSLFGQVQMHGINAVQLRYLQLFANFRSTPTIIDWVNQQFPQIFPAQDDHLRGAVSYSQSQAVKGNSADSFVDVSYLFNANASLEAQAVLQKVQQVLSQYPDNSIAILVRSRSHLQQILPYLQQAGIAYQAVDIESLAERQIIQDLLSLCYALNHLADRLAWMSVLRAPWAGLCLSDLQVIAQASQQGTVWQALPHCLLQLSHAGRQVIERLIPILGDALAQRDRVSIRRWVEGTWWALGGPGCVSQTADIHNAELFFGLLENQAKAGRMPARSEFILKLALLKAKTQSAGVAKVQVMTIHKAKGLEYDTVIVPGLDRATRSEETAMLLWQTLIDSGGRHRLLLAPIKRSGDKADRMYQFLYQTEQEKASYEAQRLLYVAVTRAKKRLLLLANIVYDEQKQQCVLPAKRSFLAALWPALEASCQAAYQPSHCKAEDESMAVTQCSLRRLPADWSLPALNLWPVQQIEQGIDNVPEPYVPEMSLQRNIGTVVHRYLAEISIQGLSQWNLTKLNLQSSTIAMQLRQLGVSADDLPQAVAEVLRVLSFSLSDNRGRWILSAQTHAQSEYVISSYTPYGLQKWIIDRTFVDEQNRRWVIDYKSSRPLPNESLASFLEREKQQYLPQLSTYAHLLNKQDPSVSCICCGLYFPALDGGWITWEWHANPSQGLLDLH